MVLIFPIILNTNKNNFEFEFGEHFISYLILYTLKGQYRHDQQGMKWE